MQQVDAAIDQAAGGVTTFAKARNPLAVHLDHAEPRGVRLAPQTEDGLGLGLTGGDGHEIQPVEIEHRVAVQQEKPIFQPVGRKTQRPARPHRRRFDDQFDLEGRILRQAGDELDDGLRAVTGQKQDPAKAEPLGVPQQITQERLAADRDQGLGQAREAVAKTGPKAPDQDHALGRGRQAGAHGMRPFDRQVSISAAGSEWDRQTSAATQ